jgi:uncharacterized protein
VNPARTSEKKRSQSDPSPLRIQETPEGVVMNIYVQPGAKKTGWAGTYGNQLKLMVQSPPVEGAANQGCLAFLAQWFGVKKSGVLLIKGEKSRSKRFLIKGLNLEKISTLIPD